MTIQKVWWKIAGMLLVLGSLIAGLTIKTGPGIASVFPSVVDANENFTLKVKGYNAKFFSEAPPKCWLKYDDLIFCAESVEVIDGASIQINFNGISGMLDTVDRVVASVLVEDEVNGLFLALDAVQLNSQESTEMAMGCSAKPIKMSAINFRFPFRTTLYESIRNLHFHVPMWFSMITLLFISWIMSILYLNKGKVEYDLWSKAFATAGLVFGVAGILTGAFWARFTWGTFWTADPKLNGAAVGVLMYFAYQILRSSIEDDDKIARVASVYNVLAFPIFIVMILVIPVVAKFSLHPGSGDSVGFKQYDLDSNLRMVFYPSVLGWIITGVWISTLLFRTYVIEQKQWLRATNNYVK